MLVNTQEFRRAGLMFNNHGYYTDAPEGSRDYVEFWDEETRRCIEGYTVGDLTISGKFYGYLNYSLIEAFPESILKDKNKVSASVDKVLKTPSFWELDVAWWKAKEVAANNPYGTGNHLVVAKTRGCGFSYKEAWDGSHNYNFIPRSKSFYLASHEDYLLKDGIMNKVDIMINHLNIHTDWYKNRHKLNKPLHKRASYVDSEGDERGYFSELIGKIVDNPNKVRGVRGKKITFEEAGSFKNLKKAWMISRESVEQGGFCAGQMSAFGTGGEKGEEIEGLEDMGSDPETFNCLAFENHWEDEGAKDVVGVTVTLPYVPNRELMNKIADDNYIGDKCGFFVPSYMANDKFMDENGNMDIENSVKFEIDKRIKLSKSKDLKLLDMKEAERPFNLTECFKRVGYNPLPRLAASEQLKVIKRSRGIQGMIRNGTITNIKDKGLIFNPTAKVNPLNKYPHKNNDDLTGCVTIYELPYKEKGTIPGTVGELYSGVLDPYYKDDAKDRTSLGALYIFKNENNITGEGSEKPVASYIARPNSLTTDFYPNVFNLLMFYSATLQSEISGGGKGVFDYAKSNRLLGLLEFEVDLDQNKENINERNKTYFMNMDTDRKKLGLLYLSEWLMTPVGIRTDGTPILRIHKIYDIGFLEEVSKWSEGGNFDRISAFIIRMFQRKVYISNENLRKKSENKSDFFSRHLFSDSQSKNYFKGDDGAIYFT